MESEKLMKGLNQERQNHWGTQTAQTDRYSQGLPRTPAPSTNFCEDKLVSTNPGAIARTPKTSTKLCEWQSTYLLLHTPFACPLKSLNILDLLKKPRFILETLGISKTNPFQRIIILHKRSLNIIRLLHGKT